MYNSSVLIIYTVHVTTYVPSLQIYRFLTVHVHKHVYIYKLATIVLAYGLKWECTLYIFHISQNSSMCTSMLSCRHHKAMKITLIARNIIHIKSILCISLSPITNQRHQPYVGSSRLQSQAATSESAVGDLGEHYQPALSKEGPAPCSTPRRVGHSLTIPDSVINRRLSNILI